MTQIQADWLLSAPSQRVCKMLGDAGHEAWFVGGCVRNAIIGAPVADLDVATNARPETVMSLAKAAGLHVIPTGIDHGTVTVIANDIPYEITTYRRDVATDGRRAVVAFSDTMVDDARRRDFTMNALYAGADGVVVDPLGGLPDLLARRVRFIDDADQRIKEDYLRILRFFRFFAWYGDPDAGIDADGLAACAENLDGIAGLSRERVGSEMLKLLAASDPAQSIGAMAASGVLAQVIPGAAPGVLNVLTHVDRDLPPSGLRRLAALGGQIDLRLSKDQTKSLKILADEMGSSKRPSALGYQFGAAMAVDILALRGAIFETDLAQADILAAERGAGMVFPVKAADLMPALSGAQIGQAMRAAETRWIASEFTLTKAELLDSALH